MSSEPGVSTSPSQILMKFYQLLQIPFKLGSTKFQLQVINGWCTSITNIEVRFVTGNRKHTLLTHGHLVNNAVPDVAPHCELCNNASLSVKHIMMECEQLMDARRACL